MLISSYKPQKWLQWLLFNISGFWQLRSDVVMPNSCIDFSTGILEVHGPKQRKAARRLDGDWLFWIHKKKLLMRSHKCKLLKCFETNFFSAKNILAHINQEIPHCKCAVLIINYQSNQVL